MLWGWLPTLTLLPVSASPALTVAWTLQHEMLFYVMFALFYFGNLLWLGLAVWALAIVLGPHGNIPLALINLEFLMGIATAWLYRRGIGHPALLVFALVVVAGWAAVGARRDLSVLIGLACAAVILGLANLERRGRLRVPEWLVILGAASYALYLVHGLVISMVARIMPASWIAILFAGVAASILAGFAYYLLVERTLLSNFDKFNKAAPCPAPSVIAAEPGIGVRTTVD
jgi:exopolysaccharide production protein ExoZ